MNFMINWQPFRQGTYQDVHFALILWYVGKIESLLKMRSSEYFYGDINLVPVLKGGVDYCKISL